MYSQIFRRSFFHHTKVLLREISPRDQGRCNYINPVLRPLKLGIKQPHDLQWAPTLPERIFGGQSDSAHMEYQSVMISHEVQGFRKGSSSKITRVIPQGVVLLIRFRCVSVGNLRDHLCVRLSECSGCRRLGPRSRY